MQGRVTQLEEGKKRWIITRTIKSSYPIKNWKFSKRKVNKMQLQMFSMPQRSAFQEGLL